MKPFFLEKVSMEEERVKVLLEELEELRAKLYTEQVSSYQVKIKQLTKEEQGLLFQLQDMALEQEEISSKLETRTKDFERLEQEYNALQKDLAAKIEIISNQGQASSKESTTLTKEVTKLQADIEKKSSEIKSLNDILVGMQVVLSEKDADLKQMKQASKKDLMTWNQEKNRLIKDKRQLESKLKHERTVSLQRHESLQKVNQQRNDLTSQLKAAQANNSLPSQDSKELKALLEEKEKELAKSERNAERQVSTYMAEKTQLLHEKQIVENLLAKQKGWLAEVTQLKEEKQAQWKVEKYGLVQENRLLTSTLETVRSESAQAMQELLNEKNEEVAVVQQRAEEALGKWVKEKEMLLQEQQEIQIQLEKVSKDLESTTIAAELAEEVVNPAPEQPSKSKGFGKKDASKGQEAKLRREKKDLHLQLETLQNESAQAIEALVQEKELEMEQVEIFMEEKLTALMQEKEQLEQEMNQLKTELANKDSEMSKTQDVEQRFKQQEAEWKKKEQTLNQEKNDLSTQIETVRDLGTHAVEKLLKEKKHEINSFKQDAKEKLTQLALEKEDLAKEKQVLELELEAQKKELEKIQKTSKEDNESLWKKAAETMKDEKLSLIGKIEFIQKETAEALITLTQEKDKEIALAMESAEVAFAKQIQDTQEKQKEQEMISKKTIELLLAEKGDLVKRIEEMQSKLESTSAIDEDAVNKTLQRKDNEIAKAKKDADEMLQKWNKEKKELEDEKTEIQILLEKAAEQSSAQGAIDVESLKEAQEKWVLEKKQLESEKASIQKQLEEQNFFIQDVMSTRDRERLESQQTIQSLTNEKTELLNKMQMMEQEILKIASSGKKAIQTLMQQKDEQIAKIKLEAEVYFEQWTQERKKMEKDKGHLVSQLQSMEKNSIAEVAQLRYQASQEIEALKKKLTASFEVVSVKEEGPSAPDSVSQNIDSAKTVKEKDNATIQMDPYSAERVNQKKNMDSRRTLSFDTHNGMVKHDKHF